MKILASRIAIAKQIGQQKARENLPIKNFQVEQQVIQRVLTHAAHQQLNANFIRQIFQQIITESVNSQMVSLSPKSTNQQHCLVVGGSGKMGAWFASYFLTIAFKVSIVDPLAHQSTLAVSEKLTELPTSLKAYDIIIIATPLRSIRSVLQSIIDKKPRGLVFDIASLKHPVADLVQNNKDLNIGSIHPLFGPDVVSLSNRTLVICQTHTNADLQLQALFQDTALTIKLSSFTQHDALMNISLALSHFMNLLIGSVLLRSKFSYTELLSFASTTFLKQIQTTAEVFCEKPELYHSIQYFNPFREELLTLISESFADLSSIILQPDSADFSQFMQKGATYFSNFMDEETVVR